MTDLNIVTVIYYHSVGPVKPDWNKSFLTIEPDLFEKHLKWLALRYTSISLNEYWQIRNGLLAPVRNPLVITFDDGYLDNWTHAFPLLRKHGFKATIFVSPDFVDETSGYRPNLEDYDQGRASLEDITEWGFLSWDEMKMMESSGLVDIQSHSMTHSRYFISEELTGFHHPGGDILYHAGNLFPDQKPHYINDSDFEKLVPYGYPLFKDSPSLMARKVEINPDFVDECIQLFDDYDFRNYDFISAFRRVEPLYNSYVKNDRLITGRESEIEYTKRVSNELRLSKEIIEQKLDKKVEFLAWPHGSNSEFLHKLALDAGYLMTTTGKAKGIRLSDKTRIPDRSVVDLSTWRKRLRTIFKMKAFSGQMPYSFLLNASRRVRNKR
jgi:hypothetical protein